MTETQDALRRFWIAVYASVTGTAMLAGCAIAFNVIDDDAGFLLVFIAGITLALGQLLNTNNKKSIFIRCGLLITLPILGMGTGILTTLLFQGDTGRGISNEGALGYLMVLAASIMYGVIAGISGLVMSFIKQKIIGKSGALPHPLASDPIFGKQARLTAALAPVLFALYFLIRGFIMQGFKIPISSSDLLSMYRLAQRQNQLTPFLGIADIAFGAAIIAGAVCLLVKALRLRRQIAGNEWSKKCVGQ
jgi:hypothetical protein